MSDNNDNQLIDVKEPIMPEYSVKRKVIQKHMVNDISGYEKRNIKFVHSLKYSWNKFNAFTFILNLIPVIKWLPKYRIKRDLPGDIFAGITVAVMHIPQGMAYGLLAGVSPSSGLYMAFFPTLVYFIFGTSRHISVGTLSVISLMTFKVVQTYATDPMDKQMSNTTNSSNGLNDSSAVGDTDYTALQVVTATAFMCGILHIAMYLLRLGNLASLLSESLVNAFTTGAAVHVTASQLKDLFGIQIPRHKGLFNIIYTVFDAIKSLPTSNIYTVCVSFSIIGFMVIMNELVKPRLSKLCSFPLPAELMAVTGATLLSFLLNMGPTYGIHLVGHIPLGLPAPVLPPVSLFGKVAADSIAIAFVSYSVTISMALIFAKKQKYEVLANQELLALGLSNLVGGLFSCVPNATSLSRSLIQEQTGGKTQIASVVSAFLILIILLWIGPFFEVLPRCVLAGIIVVALKGMYIQAAQLKRYYREGRMETITWLVTFFAVILIDIDIGLLCGIFISLASIWINGWKAHKGMLGVLPKTDIYVDLKGHQKAVELPHIKIFRYVGAINFATRNSFKKSLYESINVNQRRLRSASLINDLKLNVTNESFEVTELQQDMLVLILDLSTVMNCDIAGCQTFQEIQNDMELLQVRLFLACPNDRVFDVIDHAEALGEGKFTVFPSIHDAVLFSQSLINNDQAQIHTRMEL